MIALIPHSDGTLLPVRAQPGARKDAVVGEHAGSLKIAVSAPPERGKANDAIATTLAAALGCRVAQITLVSGATSRSKRFLIKDITPDDLRLRLEALVPTPK